MGAPQEVVPLFPKVRPGQVHLKNMVWARIKKKLEPKYELTNFVLPNVLNDMHIQFRRMNVDAAHRLSACPYN
jgi:hypothetical protein